jgi:rhamnosyltransferase
LERDVCAVIVTFRPTAEHLANVLKVRAQVRELVVVDNGSADLSAFRGASQRSDFCLIENGENLGVAAALNIGVRWARARGCNWAVFFDQDSTASDGLVAVLLAAYDADLDREQIGTLAPIYIDSVTAREMPVERAKSGQILTVSTSGSLIPISVFDRCGYFREDFFIDQVDYEFCLRMVAAGLRIVQCVDAKLMHSLGERKEYGVGGKHVLTSTRHNAGRRYYIIRNRVVLFRCYWKRFPSYCFGLVSLTLKDTLKVLLVERDRLAKLKNTAKGLIDGLLGRMGKRVEL